MTNLEDIQALVVATILAGPAEATDYFTGQSVLADDGKTLDAAEKALADNGLSIIVTPLIDWKTDEDTSGAAQVLASIGVRVRVNPANAQKPAVEVCARATRALLEYPGDADSGDSDIFLLKQDAGTITEFDSGILEYLLLFTKTAAL